LKNATPFSEATPDREAQPAYETLVVGEDAAGRLDAWLAEALSPDLSRSRVKALIEAGAVTINGEPARQAKHRIRPGDEIAWLCRSPKIPEPEGERYPAEHSL
jgi:23S rRNA pseudouridine1911/1915/1917 synthase